MVAPAAAVMAVIDTRIFSDPHASPARGVTTEAKVWLVNSAASDQYGYSIPVFDQFWFSRGGFSMQANLLDGPIPYLLRDEIKHYLRAYFNGFASAFYPEIRMCNEHSNPELGYPAGDHFKSSDEANLTYWLRLMFVREQGDDLYLGQAIPRYWLAQGTRWESSARHRISDRYRSAFNRRPAAANHRLADAAGAQPAEDDLLATSPSPRQADPKRHAQRIELRSIRREEAVDRASGLAQGRARDCGALLTEASEPRRLAERTRLGRSTSAFPTARRLSKLKSAHDVFFRKELAP